jgi:hypothetical protein
MKTKQILPIGTIFSYVGGSTFIALGDTIMKGYNAGWCPTYVNNCSQHQDINILNQSYVGLDMTPEEIWADYSIQHDALKNKLEEEVNYKLANGLYAIKPQTKTKTFHFNSAYTPKGIAIKVEKKGSNKTMRFDGVEVSAADRLKLAYLIDTSIAGLQVAKDTIKIGDIIGNTQTLRDAYNYFKSL